MLPDLPRIIQKREAGITPAILSWFRENGPATCLIEIKATTKNKIPASALLPHQRRALLDACGGGIVYKLSDEARRQVPCDAFKISYTRAFVVCAFLSSPRVALVIDIKKWRGCDRATPCVYSFGL